MSYFQKYQKLCSNSRTSTHTTDSHSNDNNFTVDCKQTGQSRNSYLKAFKKYYVDQLVKQQEIPSSTVFLQNKENFCLHEPHREKSKTSFSQQKSSKEMENYKKILLNDRKVSQQTFNPKINSMNVAEMVINRQNQLQQLIYNSISEIQREVMSIGQSSQLLKQNKMLRTSMQKMKLILKEKLKEALAKNKQELTQMFDQYSTMIKKLLEDKQKLTTQLENCKSKLTSQQIFKKNMVESYENKITMIVQQNNAQITNTKQQVQQFLDMIIRYQEEAMSEKVELERMREKIVELEIDNDKLKKEVICLKSNHSWIQQMDESGFQREELSMSKGSDSSVSRSDQHNSQNNRDKEEQSSNNYVTNRDSDQEGLTQLQRYAQKIQNLLLMLDRLQEQNKELNDFLKSCKCSRIKSKKMQSESEGSLTSEVLKKQYEKQMIQAEKDYIREEIGLREAIRKKDQCIDRLTLVIQEMRKARYESVDRITQQAARAIKK